MADNNRNRDYSHYASDDNWDKFDDRFSNESNYRQNRGEHNRVNYLPDNDDNRWDAGNYGNRREDYGRGYGASGSFDDWQGRGNMHYGGGSQNQYAQGNLNKGYGGDNRSREDWGYGYTNTGLNDDYNRSYYGSDRRDEQYDRGNQGVSGNQNREGWRGGDRHRDNDRNLWDRTRNEVSSWFNDDDNDRRRTGEHRGKGPKGYSRSADRIREDVCERLSDDDHLDASNIAVRMEGNEVILEGTVETKRDKRRAEDLVESISGVSNVQNHLVVGTPTTNAVISAVAERNSSTYANQIDKTSNKK